MPTVSIADAKNHLPRLILQVESGAPVRITRRGKSVAVLMSERLRAANTLDAAVEQLAGSLAGRHG